MQPWWVVAGANCGWCVQGLSTTFHLRPPPPTTTTPTNSTALNADLTRLLSIIQLSSMVKMGNSAKTNTVRQPHQQSERVGDPPPDVSGRSQASRSNSPSSFSEDENALLNG